MGSEPKDGKKGLLELDDPAAPVIADEQPSSLQPGTVTGPTVRPSFDVEQYAEEYEMRERMPTLTDEAALEHARVQSLPSSLPPPRRPMSTVPGPLTGSPRDSSIEIDTDEFDMDALGPGEQAAFLKDRLAPLTRVPTLAEEMSKLGALLEDSKTAYVLGFVDGILPLEIIIEATGLPELDTLRVLDRMIAQSVVVFRPR